MLAAVTEDLRAALRNDPAARSALQVILFYPGFHAMILHRIANRLHGWGLFLPSQFFSWFSRLITGVEIHPGAEIAPGVFIDHGMGVVIGETTRIERGVTLYPGVVLGGVGRQRGKRHPDVGEGALIGAGAKVLGPVEVGAHSRVGAGAVVLESIPRGCTAVGVPAQVVRGGECEGRDALSAQLAGGGNGR